MNANQLPHKKLSANTIIAFLFAEFICVLLTAFAIFNQMHIEQLSMERILLEKSNKASETISRLLFKTQTLSIFAQKGYTKEEFERMAITLTDDPSILNLLVAPGGIVTDVYPLRDNEAALGLNFFEDGAGNKEAIQALETGQLVLGGPFEGKQGSQILVGRLPVFAEGPDGSKHFWGLVSVTLKYPDILVSAGLDKVRMYGFDYEVWRINPDDGKKQIITENSNSGQARPHYLEKRIPILNAEWFFRIYPSHMWYEDPIIWAILAIGSCISFFIAFVIQNNIDLKLLKERLEVLSNTDPLTGIYNRRYFMECALRDLSRSERLHAHSAVIMLDVDYFKRFNDHFGHQAGDKVLQGVAATIGAMLRPYDLLGRYGGEEFVILASDISADDAVALAERIRAAVHAIPLIFEDKTMSITISLGVAEASANLQESIGYADQALYAAKNSGRNKVVAYGDGTGVWT